jgi:hypothetical protein
MGSQGINGAVDTIILLQKKDGKNEGKMRIKGRDIEEKCLDIIFDRDLCTWRITGESEIVSSEPKAQAEILSLLERAGQEGMTTGDIAKALNKTDPAVCNILKVLDQKGKAIKVHGKWTHSQFHNDTDMNKNENMNFTNSQCSRDNENVKNEELEIF